MPFEYQREVFQPEGEQAVQRYPEHHPPVGPAATSKPHLQTDQTSHSHSRHYNKNPNLNLPIKQPQPRHEEKKPIHQIVQENYFEKAQPVHALQA